MPVRSEGRDKNFAGFIFAISIDWRNWRNFTPGENFPLYGSYRIHEHYSDNYDNKINFDKYY